MNQLLNYPQDVIDYLKTWNVDLPSNKILSDILVKSFYASCELEEGRYATFAVQLRDQKTVENYYRFRFDKPKEFTVPVLTKLASAIDYRQSSIGIRENDNQLEIFGIIRHGTMAYRFKQGELFFGGVTMGAMMDDYLRLIVHGPGQIDITHGERSVLSLRNGQIVSPGLLALARHGPLTELIKRRLERANFPKDHLFEFSTLITLISQKMLERRKGGTLIWCCSQSPCDLDIGYKLELENKFNEITEAIYDKINPSRADRWVANPHGLKDIRGIIATNIQDAASFIADLSTIDGAVVLGSELEVLGFGAKINWKATDDFEVTLAENYEGEGKDAGALLRSLGTRHRSAAWFCFRNPDTIAVVISEDGLVSCMHKHEEKLLLWRPVRLELVDLGSA
jgi:hypothetical protein